MGKLIQGMRQNPLRAGSWLLAGLSVLTLLIVLGMLATFVGSRNHGDPWALSYVGAALIFFSGAILLAVPLGIRFARPRRLLLLGTIGASIMYLSSCGTGIALTAANPLPTPSPTAVVATPAPTASPKATPKPKATAKAKPSPKATPAVSSSSTSHLFGIGQQMTSGGVSAGEAVTVTAFAPVQATAYSSPPAGQGCVEVTAALYNGGSSPWTSPDSEFAAVSQQGQTYDDFSIDCPSSDSVDSLNPKGSAVMHLYYEVPTVGTLTFQWTPDSLFNANSHHDTKLR